VFERVLGGVLRLGIIKSENPKAHEIRRK